MGLRLQAARGLSYAKMALADCHLVFLLLIEFAPLESLVIFIVVCRWWAADGHWRVLVADQGLWVVGRWL